MMDVGISYVALLKKSERSTLGRVLCAWRCRGALLRRPFEVFSLRHSFYSVATFFLFGEIDDKTGASLRYGTNFFSLK